MTLSPDKLKIIAAAEARSEELGRLSDRIWEFAEIGFQEHNSAKLLTDYLTEIGFEVKTGTSGMPTAFEATFSRGSGGPVIGLLTEYDALPGLSQKAGQPTKEPVVDGAPGQGCGHNTMGPMQILGAAAIKDVIDELGLEATIKIYGGPAEEILASRPFMARDGLFENDDVVIDCHADQRFQSVYGTLGAALYSLRAVFHGKTSHAGGNPWMGRSAADAVELMHAGTERMREHVEPTNRIHWITTYGGEAPNIVPDRAETWYLIRDTDDKLMPAVDWVMDCAEAAAKMTQTRVEIETLGACHQRYYNKALAEALYANIEAVGLPEYTEAEQETVKRLQTELGADPVGLDYEVRLNDADKSSYKGGSSDVGDVTLVAPTGCIRYPIFAPGSPGHHWAVTAMSGFSTARKGLVASGKAVGLTIYDLIVNPDIIAAAKAEFAELTAARPFKSFMPDEVEPPLSFYDNARYVRQSD